MGKQTAAAQQTIPSPWYTKNKIDLAGKAIGSSKVDGWAAVKKSR